MTILDTDYYVNSSIDTQKIIQQIVNTFDDFREISDEGCQDFICNLNMFGIVNHTDFIESELKRYDVGYNATEEFARDYCFEHYSNNEVLEIIGQYVHWEKYFDEELAVEFDKFQFGNYIYFGKLI